MRQDQHKRSSGISVGLDGGTRLAKKAIGKRPEPRLQLTDVFIGQTKTSIFAQDEGLSLIGILRRDKLNSTDKQRYVRCGFGGYLDIRQINDRRKPE